MMKTLILFCLTLMSCCSNAFAQTAPLNVVPQPKSIEFGRGTFTFDSRTKIFAGSETEIKSANVLNDSLMRNYGFKLGFTDRYKKQNTIIFISAPLRDKYLPSAESYQLQIEPQDIRIAGDEAGRFYALQTLMQMLPANNFRGKVKLPVVNIEDTPRFAYRGMHLDASRHFMPVSFVKKYLDLMAQYKFNQFHWHLTDDQGWRVEIKKYPKLTEIGSTRSESVKEKNLNPYVGDGVPVSGFYTQEQIKEVVVYAKLRHINVIPEIELPGHSSAALAAYPNLGCKIDYQYKVQTTWGIFKEVYCPKEETFQFLEDVLSEVIELFPDSPYIHIGGDEVLKDFWKDSPEVTALKLRENLKDEHEVQSYFIRRMEKFINSKGKKIIGWDEILEGGVAPNAAIMSWRGEQGGIAAAKAEHDVIMTPNTFLYFDYGQGDPKNEPLNIGSYIPLEKVYSYNPIPPELSADEAKHVLGAQANVWTEYLPTAQTVEYMVFPRMLALSEVVWSPAADKNFADFTRRLQNQYPRLDKQEVNYRIPAPNNLENILVGGSGKTKINLRMPPANGKIFYTLDGNAPDANSKLYKKPFELNLKPNEKVDLKTIVVNEKNRKSSVYSATVWRREKLKAVGNYRSLRNGMIFSLFKGKFGSVADFANLPEVSGGGSKFFDFRQLNEKENFGVIWEAYLDIPADEIYEFQMQSAGGAVLTIDGEKTIDADEPHEKKSANGDAALTKGFHHLRVQYFQTTGESLLNLRFGIKNKPLNGIGSSVFY